MFSWCTVRQRESGEEHEDCLLQEHRPELKFSPDKGDQNLQFINPVQLAERYALQTGQSVLPVTW